MSNVSQDIVKLLQGDIQPLSISIVEFLMHPQVQHHLFGFRKGTIEIDVKDGICIAVRVSPEFRRGYEIFVNPRK